VKKTEADVSSLEFARDVVQKTAMRTGLDWNTAVQFANGVVRVKKMRSYPFTVVVLERDGNNVEVAGVSKYNPADKKLGQPYDETRGYCLALSRAAKQYIKRFM